MASLAGLSSLIGSRDARAEGGSATASTPVVEVRVEQDSGPATELEDAVSRAVGRVGAAVDFVRAPREPRLEASRFARVNVRSSSQTIQIEIQFARGGRTVRTVSRSTTPAVEGEEVGLVVESALESELDAIRERPPPPPPPPPVLSASATAPAPAQGQPPTKVEPKSPPATLAVFGGAFGGAGAFGVGEGPVARLGAELGVASSATYRPSVSIRASYTLPFDAGSRRAVADVSVVGLRVFPAAEWLELTRVSLGIGVGVGVDILSVSARSDVIGAKSEPVSIRIDPVVSPTVLLRFGLVNGVTLAASVGLDVGLSSPTWYADDGGTVTTVFAPMRARPVGLVGVEFAPWGDDRVGRARLEVR